MDEIILKSNVPHTNLLIRNINRIYETFLDIYMSIKPDTPINDYTRFCLNTAKSKFSLVSPVADW